MSHKNEIVPDKRQQAFVGQLWIEKKRYRRVLARFVEVEDLPEEQLNSLLVERLLQLKKKLTREVEASTDKDGLFFSEVLRLFLAHVEANRDKLTVRQYRQQLNRYQKIVGDYRIRLHSSKFTDQLVLALRKAGLNDHSCNSYLRAVRAIVNWSWGEGQIPSAIKVKSVRASKPLPKVFSQDELLTLRQYLEEGWQQTRRRRFLVLLRAWWFFRYTGMRGSELLTLKWDNVYADRLELRSTADWKVKGRRDAIIPIAKPLKAFLSSQDLKGEKFVLDDGTGKPNYATAHGLMQSMKKALEILQIKVNPLHSFRSTVATELLAGESSNPVQVQKLLRHQSIQTTMSYLNSDHLQQVDLVNQLGNSPQNTVSKKKSESRKPSIHLAYSRKSKNDC